MSTETSPRGRREHQPAEWASPLRTSTRAAAFWLAIALPFAYLPGVALVPALFADPVIIVSAVAGNLLALVIGYGHDPSIGQGSRRG